MGHGAMKNPTRHYSKGQLVMYKGRISQVLDFKYGIQSQVGKTPRFIWRYRLSTSGKLYIAGNELKKHCQGCGMSFSDVLKSLEAV